MRLYLAAHHDDALLSMPARLCHAAREHGLSLAVIFSDEAEELEDLCRSLHRQLRVFACELGLKEARLRGVNLRQCLRRWRTRENLDRDEVERVTQRVLQVVREVGATEIVVPSTLVHVDHALTRVAGERLVAAGLVSRLAYQPDQPYASLWPDCTQIDGTTILQEDGTVSRAEVSDILERLSSHIGRQDAERILSTYGHTAECRVEPLWLLNEYTVTDGKVHHA